MDKLTEVRNRGIAEARNGLSRLRDAATARLSDERGSALAAVLVLVGLPTTVGSPSAGLTVSNDYPSSAASAVHANNKLSAPTAVTINTAGASVVGGLTANGVITGVGCPTWAWTCNASAGVRAMPEIDVDS